MEQLKDIRLVLCDLDGTLLNDQKELDTNILNVIKKKNIMLSLVTGRNYHIVKDIVEKLNIHIPYCTNNGATIFLGNSCIFQLTIHKPDLITCLSILNAHHISYLTYTSDRIYVNNYHPRLDFMIKRLSNRCEIFYEETPYIDTIFKITIVNDREEEMKKIVQTINTNCSNAHCFRSEGNIYTVTHLLANKGTGVEKILEMLNMDENNTLVFGDNFNDLTMFEVVDQSVAMSNSPQQIKELSKYITTSNNENGVSDFIDKYVL